MRNLRINAVALVLFARHIATGSDYPNLWHCCWLDAHRS